MEKVKMNRIKCFILLELVRNIWLNNIVCYDFIFCLMFLVLMVVIIRCVLWIIENNKDSLNVDDMMVYFLKG